MKVCRNCKKRFEPTRSTFEVCCSPACGIEYAKTDKAKAHAAKALRADTRQRKAALKTRSDWMKEAQSAFNAFIRERDAKQPCISCETEAGADVKFGGGWDCGHYRSIGASPELRFEPMNAHKQCVKCNRYLSGNASHYRAGLIKRIGAASVHWLDGHHEPKKYTIDDLKQIKRIYKEALKMEQAK